MSENKRLEIIKKIFDNYSNSKKRYESLYTNTYDDEYSKVIIDYELVLSEIKKNYSISEEEICKYFAEIKIFVKQILIGDENGENFEEVYYEDDLPSWVWDDFEDEIKGELEELEQLYPLVCFRGGLEF